MSRPELDDPTWHSLNRCGDGRLGPLAWPSEIWFFVKACLPEEIMGFVGFLPKLNQLCSEERRLKSFGDYKVPIKFKIKVSL